MIERIFDEIAQSLCLLMSIALALVFLVGTCATKHDNELFKRWEDKCSKICVDSQSKMTRETGHCHCFNKEKKIWELKGFVK